MFSYLQALIPEAQWQHLIPDFPTNHSHLSQVPAGQQDGERPFVDMEGEWEP